MTNSKQILVLGTSTDIGKSYLTCKIINNNQKNNIETFAVKPIITGFNIDDADCDTVRIANQLKLPLTQENIEKISPFRLKTPLSPITAAKIEGSEIKYNEVLDFCRKSISHSKARNIDLIIESAGGIMTPICHSKTFLDLAQDLDIEIFLVGACFLGGISATLSAYENLKTRNCKNVTILINNHLDYDQKYLKINDFISELKIFTDCEVFLVENFIK